MTATASLEILRPARGTKRFLDVPRSHAGMLGAQVLGIGSFFARSACSCESLARTTAHICGRAGRCTVAAPDVVGSAPRLPSICTAAGVRTPEAMRRDLVRLAKAAGKRGSR